MGGREGLGDGPIQPASAGACHAAAAAVVDCTRNPPPRKKRREKNLEHINRERGQ